MNFLRQSQGKSEAAGVFEIVRDVGPKVEE
jgi:hypothetical protein